MSRRVRRHQQLGERLRSVRQSMRDLLPGRRMRWRRDLRQPPGVAVWQWSHALDLSKARADASWCGNSGFLTDGDLFFAWTADHAGKATFSLEGATGQLNNPLAVTTDPTCQNYELGACAANFDGYGRVRQSTRSTLTLNVEQDVTYYITAGTPLKLSASPGILKVEEP